MISKGTMSIFETSASSSRLPLRPFVVSLFHRCIKGIFLRIEIARSVALVSPFPIEISLNVILTGFFFAEISDISLVTLQHRMVPLFVPKIENWTVPGTRWS